MVYVVLVYQNIMCTSDVHRSFPSKRRRRRVSVFYPSFPGLFPRAVHNYLQSDPIKRALLLMLMLLLLLELMVLLPITRGGPDDATLDHDDDGNNDIR